MTTKTTEGGLIEQELNFEKFAYKNPADKSSHQAQVNKNYYNSQVPFNLKNQPDPAKITVTGDGNYLECNTAKVIISAF